MDWILSFLVVFGNLLLSKKMKWGWIIICINSLAWIYYALILTPPQYGLIPSAIVNFIISLSGIINWFDIGKHK